LSHPNIVQWDEVPARKRTEGDISATWRPLGAAAGSRRLGLNRLQVDPGRRSTAFHVHGAEEETFYVLGGSATLVQGEAACAVGPRDCIVHVARGEPHVLVAGDDGLDVLVFGPDTPVEACYLPRAGFAFLGPTAVATLPDQNGWRRDVAAGPFPVPEPGERLANVVNLVESEPETWRHGDCGAESRRLADPAGSVTTGLNHDFLEPGMMPCPPHCHSAEDELFVVLAGSGTCRLGEDEHPVRPGSVVARPAGTGVAHGFWAGPDGMELLSYGTRVPHDNCWYPRSGKLLIGGLGGAMFRVEKVDYWDGEDGFEPRR
jgi:uncharacterized cupin superfamily protein